MQIDLATLIKSKMSVQMGDLFIPGDQVLDFVVNSCHPLLLDNDSDSFPLSVVGSSVLISYCGRCIQVFTSHQLINNDRRAQDVRLIESSPRPLIFGPNAGSSPGFQSEEFSNLEDLVFCEYHLEDGTSLKNRFLRINATQFVMPPFTDAKEVLVYFFIGFPGQAVDYQLDGSEEALSHLYTRWIRLHLEPEEEPIFEVPNRVHFRSPDSFESMDIDPDGLSGSPVFSVYQSDDLQLHFGFCGIITHANSQGSCAIIGAPVIDYFLRSSIER